MRWKNVGIVLFAVLPLCAQETPRVGLELLGRIDDGLGGVLVGADGARREFHLEVRSLRTLLRGQRQPTAASTALAPGSAEATALLQQLDAWLDATFSRDEQQRLLALPKLPDAHTQDADFARQRAELLRAVRRYERVTRPQITKVFAGRGTVSLSLQLQLGDAPPQQLLWRRLGDDAFARMHLDTDVEPVPIDGPGELLLLQGLAHWLAPRLGGFEKLWQPEPADLADDVRLVLRAFRGYREATAPRLRSAGTVMDAGNTGSDLFEIADAQDRVQAVRFDHAAGTATPGRIRDGGNRDSPLVDLGSARETELLTLLTRTAELRRRWLGDRAATDYSLQRLDEQLAAYRATFAPKK